MTDTPDIVERTPCPFCGGEAIFYHIGNAHTKSRATEIKCTKCRIMKRTGAIHQSLAWTQQTAFEHWNTRADNASLRNGDKNE